MPEANNYVDPSKYIVLDVETNGLSSVRDDLLSISLFNPDTGELYDRFLPLELNTEVTTTQYNGITTKDLKGLSPLTQDEVDRLILDFELQKRIILTYGGIDEKFIVKYFQRHHLQGIEYFAFYNFKHEIISSRYSEGNITKDNLCNIYGIENVKSVHSGKNDCILEWKLFERMNGNRLLITNNKVFEFNNEYIVPASYITSYPNLKYYLPALPQIACESSVVFSLPIPAEHLKKFPTNFNGMIVEHLINSMLHVQKIHSEKVLLENKKRLNYLGCLPSIIDTVPMIFNPDGSMVATRPQDKKLESDINSVVQSLKRLFMPLIDFIENGIFSGQRINSQELVINHDRKILALCDLSSNEAVLEIKASSFASVQSYAEQLYYEANGRKCYILLTDWSRFPKLLSYNIYEVSFNVKEYIDPRVARLEKAKKTIETEEIELLSFIDTKSPVKLKCKACGNEWSMSYSLARTHHYCPNCSPPKKERSVKTEKKRILSAEEKLVQKFLKYQAKLEYRSQHKLTALSYKDSKSSAKAKCLACGYEWEARADHLLDRPYCPICKRK